MIEIPAKIGFQQRVFPLYRAPFFKLMAEACPRGFSLFAGSPRGDESIEPNQVNQGLNLVHARNFHISKGRTYLCWQLNLLSWLRRWNPDVLVLEANMRYIMQDAAVRWMHARGRPVIGWGLGSGGGQAGLLSVFKKQFISQFDALVTYSAPGAAQYRLAGFPDERIFIAQNAVTPRPEKPIPGKTYMHNSNLPVVLFVGRLQTRKRVDMLIRACAALPSSLKPELWIVGDGPEKEMLMGLARQVYPAAKFFGVQHGKDLEPAFTGADLFVLPGTGGLAVQEAMTYGLPVMVAEADGTREELVRPENGWLLPPGDSHALQALLQDALSDPLRLRRMGEESYRIVAEEINIENMVAVFQSAVNSVWEK